MCFQLFLFLKNILIKQRILYDFYGTTRNKLNMQALHLLFLFFYFIYFPSHRKNKNNTNWLYVIRVFFFSLHSLYPGGLLHFVIYIEIKKNKLNDAYALIYACWLLEYFHFHHLCSEFIRVFCQTLLMHPSLRHLYAREEEKN